MNKCFKYCLKVWIFSILTAPIFHFLFFTVVEGFNQYFLRDVIHFYPYIIIYSVLGSIPIFVLTFPMISNYYQQKIPTRQFKKNINIVAGLISITVAAILIVLLEIKYSESLGIMSFFFLPMTIGIWIFATERELNKEITDIDSNILDDGF